MKQLTVFIFSFVLSSLVVADECSVDLKYNIRVSSEFLEVSDNNAVLYKITQGGLLSVKGAQVDLNEKQKALAEEYAGEVGALVPQWIRLVSDALTVAEEAVHVAFSAAFGDDSKAAANSAQALANARERFEKSSEVEDGVYSISVTSFEDVDGAFDEEFSENIEDVVMASIGAIFVEMGKALLSPEKEFEETMESFGESMDLMGAELEVMGEALGEAAEVLCDGMRDVQALEEQLVKEIPELAGYPLFES